MQPVMMESGVECKGKAKVEAENEFSSASGAALPLERVTCVVFEILRFEAKRLCPLNGEYGRPPKTDFRQ